jgi:hypothetical protein
MLTLGLAQVAHGAGRLGRRVRGRRRAFAGAIGYT